jgi:hypothetical protein
MFELMPLWLTAALLILKGAFIPIGRVTSGFLSRLV